jgi:predicted XRE-type DNA-binding protein
VITRETLQRYEQAGVVAAARALQLHTNTIHRLARSLGVQFKSHNTADEQARRAKLRAALAPKVRRLARHRMTQREMCTHLGISREVLRRTAKDFHIDINSRSR